VSYEKTARFKSLGDYGASPDIRGGLGLMGLEELRKFAADGYTIVLESVERYVRALALLLHSIEVELNFPTQVNAYVTPPQSQGFVTHYDEHDVLILQIRGSKIWHLYDGADVAPHEMRRREPVATAELPSPTDVRLEAGDVLYLPPGRVHAAEATSEVSVHLTLGLHAPTLHVRGVAYKGTIDTRTRPPER